MKISAGKYRGLRRLADRGGRFRMTAVDQRPPIENPIKAKRGVPEAPWEDVARFKELLIEELQHASSAMLLDPHYGYPRGVTMLDPAIGMILTLEDSIYQETSGGRLSSEIDAWSVEKIKRAGGDAVKVLAWYRPDAEAGVCRAQEDFTARIGEACARYDIPFVFELLIYPLARDAEQTRPELVLESVRRFAASRFGVDLFKLESPVAAEDVKPLHAAGGMETQRWFAELGSLAGRPWVMLSAGAGMQEFRRVLEHAYEAGASGYLAGRAIWSGAFAEFPDWAAIRKRLRSEALAYMHDINALTEEAARPWHAHPCFGEAGVRVEPADATFRYAYAGFGD